MIFKNFPAILILVGSLQSTQARCVTTYLKKCAGCKSQCTSETSRFNYDESSFYPPFYYYCCNSNGEMCTADSSESQCPTPRTSPPPPPRFPPPPPDPPPSTGAVVGVSVFLIVICGLGAWLIRCCCCGKNRRSDQPRVEMTQAPSHVHPSLHTVQPNIFFRHSYGQPAQSTYLGNNQQIPALHNEHRVVEVVPHRFSPEQIRQENDSKLGYPSSSDDVLQQIKGVSQNCLNCGSPEAGGAFCGNCGAKHSKTSTE